MKTEKNLKNKLRTKYYNFDVRQSLRIRLSLTMICAVLIIIVLCWGINKVFLQRVYEKTKLEAVEEAYEFINSNFTESVLEAYAKNDISNETIDKMFTEVERAASAGGLSVTIYKRYSVGNENYYEIFYPINNSDRDRRNFQNKIGRMDDIEDVANITVLKNEKNYVVYEIYDSRLKFRNLELTGVLDSGVYVNLNTNFAILEESANISNRFLAWIGIGVGIFASIALYFISKNITKPILELSEIAEKMANLDFDVDYKVNTKDEIAVLGNSINFLSKKLYHYQ